MGFGTFVGLVVMIYSEAFVDFGILFDFVDFFGFGKFDFVAAVAVAVVVVVVVVVLFFVFCFVYFILFCFGFVGLPLRFHVNSSLIFVPWYSIFNFTGTRISFS